MRSLKDFYENCRDLSVVNSQRAFSRLWGMRPSWFSSTLSHRRTPTTAALVTFYIRMEKIRHATEAELAATDDRDEIEALAVGLAEVRDMASEVWNEIVRRSVV